MTFQRLTRQGPSAVPPPAPRSTPKVSQAATGQQSLAPSSGGFQRLTKPQVITNPVAAARATARRQAQPAGQMVATGVAGVKAPAHGGLQGVKYASGGGFLSHLGSDVLGVVTGLPSAVELAGKNVVGGLASAYGVLPGVPYQHEAESYARRVLRQDLGVVKATAHDYIQRYGPTVRSIAAGHPLAAAEHLGHAFYEHPGLVALDVGSLAGVAGVAARAAGAAAKAVAPESALARSRFLSPDVRIAPTEQNPVVPPRYRPPTPLEAKMAEGTGYEATSTVFKPRRPYSRNPLTREIVQKPVQRLVQTRVRPALEDLAPGVFGQQARFNRAAAKTAREVRLTGEEHLNTTVGQLAAPYARLVRNLKPIQTRAQALKTLVPGVGATVPHEADVVHLHLRGLLEQPGLTPVQARDRFLQTMRTNIAAAKATGQRTAQAEKNVARFAAIPESYLDLNTAPAHVQEAVREGRTLIDETQRRAVESGLVTPETARASATRAVDVLLGGGKWDPQAQSIVTPAGFRAGPEARFLPDIAVDRIGRTAVGRAVGRLTKPKVYQSHGTLIGRGGVVTSGLLPVHATRTVIAHEQLSGNVGRLIEQTAFRHGGEVASGPKALKLLQADPDNVVLVSRRGVQHALSQMQELQPGQALNETTAGAIFHEVAPDAVAVRANPHDFIAVPKAAMDEWRTAAKAPTSLGRGYDSVLSLWKSGLLAFTPRWYTNNLVTNAALYGLAAGPDLRSLRLARSEALKQPGVVPERIASTAAAEYGRTAPALGRVEALPRFKNGAAAGFALNNRLESFWRRAAYIHAAKGLLRDDGGKFRHLTQEEVADRIAAMPEPMKAEAIRITEQFMGNFRHFNRLERDVLKRVFPFYSWMRFVGSLTVGLPFRSPLRAQALALMSEARKVENPLDEIRPLYQRGRINIHGFGLPTTGMNPFATAQDFIAAAASGANPADVATELVRAGAQQGSSPLVQIAAGTWSGRNPFTGRDYSAPPGYGGSVAAFGQEPQRFNQATGQWETYHPTPSLLEQVAQAVPYVPQLRSMLAGANRPYDVTSTPDLIQHALGGGPPSWQLFKPSPVTGRGQAPLPYISPLAQILGFNIQRIDPQADVAAYQRELANAARARAASRKAQAKARARVGG